jgi:hypothetical protein
VEEKGGAQDAMSMQTRSEGYQRHLRRVAQDQKKEEVSINSSLYKAVPLATPAVDIV